MSVFFTLVIYYPIYFLRNRNVYKGASCKYLIITGNTDNLKASSNSVSNVVSYSTQCLWKTVVTSNLLFSHHHGEEITLAASLLFYSMWLYPDRSCSEAASEVREDQGAVLHGALWTVCCGAGQTSQLLPSAAVCIVE